MTTELLLNNCKYNDDILNTCKIIIEESIKSHISGACLVLSFLLKYYHDEINVIDGFYESESGIWKHFWCEYNGERLDLMNIVYEIEKTHSHIAIKYYDSIEKLPRDPDDFSSERLRKGYNGLINNYNQYKNDVKSFFSDKEIWDRFSYYIDDLKKMIKNVHEKVMLSKK